MDEKADENTWEWYEERAAVLQYDGGITRGDSEFGAFALTVIWCRRTGQRLPSEGPFRVHRDYERLYWNDAKGAPDYQPERPSWVLWTSDDGCPPP